MLDNTLRKKICGTLALDGLVGEEGKKAFLNYAENSQFDDFFATRHGSIDIS